MKSIRSLIASFWRSSFPIESAFLRRLAAPYGLRPPSYDAPSFATGEDVRAPARLFQEIGGLDERYFIYFEETDWNLRARAHGYRRRYVPDSRIYHKVSQAMKTGSPTSDYYYARNHLLFFEPMRPCSTDSGWSLSTRRAPSDTPTRFGSVG